MAMSSDVYQRYQQMELGRRPSIEASTYPDDRLDIEQWLTWKETDDGRKIPRAPYVHSGFPDRFVNAQDPEVWTDFETAQTWAEKLPGHQLAFTIRDRAEHPNEDLVLIDYDHARDPDTGALHPTVREHLERAGSYADVSPSGTGVHVLCQGALPEDVKTIADSLPFDEKFPDAGIEVYDSARFVAMSGDHLQGTPADTTDSQAFLDQLVDEYATVVEGTPDALLSAPEKSKEELAAIDTTDDIQDVFDAIQQIDPGDIQVRSSVTEERGDGSKSLNPSWASSDSGTRLAQVDSGWIYREGMIGLSALQVVALEEGIISDERSYPSGKAFWEAVDALRERGAHIPDYEPDSSSGTTRPAVDVDPPVEGGTRVGADVDPTLEHEVRLLRETVMDQRSTIDELEATLEERNEVIEEQRDRIIRLEAHLEDLQERLDVDGLSPSEMDFDESTGTWQRMKDRLFDRDSRSEPRRTKRSG